jgi:hypothetical protein
MPRIERNAIREHLVKMEEYVELAEVEHHLLVNDDEEKSVLRFEMASSLAQIHSQAARILMQAEEWEIPWQGLDRIDRPAPWQDSPVAHPGGPLRGPEPAPGDDPPPVAP